MRWFHRNDQSTETPWKSISHHETMHRNMKEWISSRKSLYLSLRKMVDSQLGNSTRKASLYERQFLREFKGKWSPSSKNHLLKAAAKAQILYLADFHCLKESQKAHHRILKGLSGKVSFLAVEFLESQHQKWIDKYMSGRMSEKEFLKQIQWQKRWGFPWDHYRPLLEWARQERVSVRGLNLHLEESHQAGLYLRDQHAAHLIADLRKLSQSETHEKLVVVIFGEQHLAEPHLPREVNRLCRHLREVIVFQNQEEIFFDLMAEGKDASVDVVKLDDSRYVVLNIAPWVKWQDYLLFLEKFSDQSLERESDLELTEDIYAHVKLLAHDLKISPPPPDFVVYTSQDQRFWSWIQKKLNYRERNWVKALIDSSTSFYIPQHKVGYMARLSVNHAAMLATSILHAEKSHCKNLLLKFPEDFFGLIWQEAFRYFGSKLINPRRKTDTLVDIKMALANEKYLLSNEALRLALTQKMNEQMFISSGKRPRIYQESFRINSFRLAARLLGGMMGEKFYGGFRLSKTQSKLLSRWFCEPVQGESFENFYLEVLEVMESWPESFVSKKERL